MTKKGPRRSTSLIAHDYQPPAGFRAVQPPVHKASTVVFADTAALRARSWKEKTGYTYGLLGTPTTFTLEERIATLEGGVQTVLVPSGLAAITVVAMALLKAGDELLIPDNAYGPSKDFARHELAGWGIAHRFYDPMDPPSLAAAIGERTRLVWLEAPGSVTMEFPDLGALIGIARERAVTVALDNTWGAGVAFDPFRIGAGAGNAPVAVDISAQALTKYPSGGGDVLMGSVTTRDAALHLRIKGANMRIGFGVGANDAELVLRSLPSLAIRYEAQARAGRELAAWWASRPEVVQVLHPALRGIARPRALEARVQRSSGAVLDRLRRALFARAGRRLRRFAESCSGSATRGPARSASSSRTTWRRCARSRAGPARWCASRWASRTSRT